MSVYFDEVQKYQKALVESSIHRGLDELGIDLLGKKSVFIKVNIVRPARPKSCIVTHPVVVKALINVFREQGVTEITIGDGPAAGVNAEQAFRKSGYLHLADEMKVELIDINRAKTVKKEWDHGSLELPSVLFERDLYVNIAKMKTHFHTGVTLSIKNQQGLLNPEAKKANHREYNLHESLFSISKVVQPDFVMIDAIEAMEGEGPTTGTRKETRIAHEFQSAKSDQAAVDSINQLDW